MVPEVLVKDLRERGGPAAALAFGLTGLVVFAFAIGSALEDTVTQLTADIPDALDAFIGGGAPGGYVVGEMFNLMAPIALVAYAVLTGASATAREEATGTMSMLSAQPIGRGSILTAKVVGLVGALLGVGVVFGTGSALASAAFDTGLTLGNVAATVVHLFALALLFGVVAVAVGAATGAPTVAASVAGTFAAVSHLTASMLPLAGYDDAARLSPWFYYAGSEPLADGLDAAHLGVLTGLTAIVLTAAYLCFDRRDLRG